MRKRRKPEAVRPEDAIKARRVKMFQMALWTLTILIQMGIVKCLEIKAATAPEKDSELTIRYEIESSPDGCTQPDISYQDEDGTRYALKSWTAVPVSIPSISRKVQKEIIYDQAEGVTVLPETIKITAYDGERGQTVTAVCPMEEQEVIREEWQEGFVFTVTFHTYEAGYYQLADRLIPYNDEKPEVEGCEDLLLDLAGLEQEDYQVTHVQWSGEVYTDEAGNQCRDAAAFGRKRMRDYRAKYSGTAVFPEKEGWQTVAVYHLPRTESVEVLPDKVEMPEVTMSQAEERAADSVSEPITLWERITRTLMITIAVGTVLFLGGLMLLAILRVVKKLRSCYNRRKRKSTGGQ